MEDKPVRASARISRRPEIVEEKKERYKTPPRSSLFRSEDKRSRALRHWRVEEERFELDSRYVVTDFMGKGAYGVVIAASDNRDGSRVAIKKAKQIFTTNTLAKRTLRELRILRHLNHENIISIDSILRPVSTQLFQELYIVMELMETDLAVIIKSTQPLRDEHVQFFIYQILRALKYLHSSKIVHRDLKPRNLLVNSNCDLKIADFGLARIYSQQNETKFVQMTNYVTTRWYRAPEVIVSWHRYTAAVDIWAVGCILAELLARWPTFPGKTSFEQVELIAQSIGKPPESFISKARHKQYRHLMREFEDKPGNLHETLKHANPLAIDLLDRMLRYNPDERVTAAEALCHPYLALLHDPLSEPDGPELPPSEFEFEVTKPTIDDLREELLNEVRRYHPYMKFTHNVMSMMRPRTKRHQRGASLDLTKPTGSSSEPRESSVGGSVIGVEGSIHLSPSKIFSEEHDDEAKSVAAMQGVSQEHTRNASRHSRSSSHTFF